MYLKALEIQGFKSFPEKVTLSFEKDFTAIVGPNGSGKSNISDALSWVMGEQRSKALRGSKMEDVIFGGSEQRNQLSFAQVSLILDNEDGVFDVDAPELMITRRYYRSGESEYYINKKSVRLKDVNEILMDTGLGRDGYSIIGQGRIDDIISAKSEDRREVFEEAAGISRYRYRKEEAERKLEHTQDALLRIGDKISELEISVGPLKEQAETAKKYLLLRDELRELEISVWMDSLDKLDVKNAELSQAYAEASDSRTISQSELEGYYKDSEHFSEKIRELDTKAEALRNEISSIDSKAAGYESDAAVINAEIASGRESAVRIGNELDEQSRRGASMDEQIGRKLNRISEIDIRISEIDKELSVFLGENQTVLASDSEKGRRINTHVAAAAARTAEASAERARAKTLAESGVELNLRASEYRAYAKDIETRLEKEKNELKQTLQNLEAARKKRGECENIVNGNKLKSEARQRRADELKRSIDELAVERGKLSSRINLLTEMEKEYEGFSKAVRTVMQESEKGALSNICGTVAELVSTQDDYTVAIETALGASMQSVVVLSEEDGKAAINLLKRRDAGRATFLPVSTIKGSVLTERGFRNERGVIGTAIELVSFQPEYTGIFANLLGRTVVVENMDTAIRISRSFSSRFRIVTLDGQIINAGGSMTGGSSARNVGILSRANELSRLIEHERKTVETAKTLAERFAEAERELKKVIYETQTAQAELHQAENESMSAQASAEQRQRLVSDIEHSIEQNCTRIEDTERIIKSDKAETEAAAGKASKLDVMAEAERAEAERLSQDRSGIAAKLDELAAKLAALRSEKDTVASEKQSTLTAVAEWRALIKDLESSGKEKRSVFDSTNARLEGMEQRFTEKSAAAAEQRGLAQSEREKLAAITGEKLEYEGKRDRCDKKAQDKNRELLELEHRFSGLEQKKLSAELEEKQLTDKLWDSYELTRTSAEKLRHELDSLSKASKRVQEIKRAMSALGTPNLGAIDEYERVSVRYSFLTEQRDDIVKAKNELDSIIRDITNEMRVIFQQQFEAINAAFKETFAELFGGGRAELELEDGMDALEAGIEIRVQPPGKTLKTLSLLSGGERAFVAIAIYFAIMKIRPTPFCALDEIETALDEKNVDTFARYLRRMSGKTQFLVITHRRGTMEEADMLYGVTMQHGVSKVLSLDLESALKESE